MKWFSVLLQFGIEEDCTEISLDHLEEDPDRRLISSIVEKVILVKIKGIALYFLQNFFFLLVICALMSCHGVSPKTKFSQAAFLKAQFSVYYFSTCTCPTFQHHQIKNIFYYIIYLTITLTHHWMQEHF